MRLLGQFRVCLFFFMKRFRAEESTKTQNKRFPHISAFFRVVAFVVFCSLIFVLLVDFCLIYVFVRLNFFRKKKKKKKRVKIAPKVSYILLLEYTLLNHPWRIYLHVLIFICENLFLFMITCKNLFCVCNH